MASELFGVRLTPSTRLRDPHTAKIPTQHVLTGHQIDLWNLLFPRRTGRLVDIQGKSIQEVVNDITAKLPEKGKAKMIPAPNGITLEIIIPR